MNLQAAGAVFGGILGLAIAGGLGLAIGVFAKVLMPGPDPGGWFATMLLGIAGSWIGGFGAGALGIMGPIPVLIASVLGAMVLLLVHRLYQRGH